MRFRDHDMPDVIKNSTARRGDVSGARETPIYSTVNKARNKPPVTSHVLSPRFDRADDAARAHAPPHYATYRPQNELERIYNQQPNRGALTVDRRHPRHNTVTFVDSNPEQVRDD